MDKLGNTVRVNGVDFISKKDACNYFNLKYTSVLTGMRKYGITFEESVNYYLSLGPVVHGRRFKSDIDACNYYGVSIHAVRNHKKKGSMSLEKAIDLVKNLDSKRKVFVNGIEFKTAVDACKYYEVKVDSVRGRMKDYNISLEDAINHYVSLQPLVNGIRFKTKTDVYRYYGLTQSVVSKYEKEASSFEEAINLALSIKNKSVMVNGISFKLEKDACSYFGVSYSSVISRKHNKKCSLEEAINYFVGLKDKDNSISVNGATFKSSGEVYRYYGISGDLTNYYRRKYGFSLEEAVNHILNKKEGVFADGMVFSTIRDASVYFKVNESTVKNRINIFNWTIEEALELTPREVEGVISKGCWNNMVSKVFIEKYIGNNYYKCIESGNIRYYSKIELLKKWKELKKIKKG